MMLPAERRLSVARQDSISKLRRKSLETVKYWTQGKQYCKYLLLVSLLSVVVVWGAPVGREQRVEVDPVEEAVRLQGEWVREEVATLRRERSGRILVMSSWRSGSSFVGGLLDSHPGVAHQSVILIQRSYVCL